jgi:hypothetical protein
VGERVVVHARNPDAFRARALTTTGVDLPDGSVVHLPEVVWVRNGQGVRCPGRTPMGCTWTSCSGGTTR